MCRHARAMSVHSLLLEGARSTRRELYGNVLFDRLSNPLRFQSFNRQRLSNLSHPFLREYALLVDRAVCYCNADRDPVIVFKQHGARREVTDPGKLQALEEAKRHD